MFEMRILISAATLQAFGVAHTRGHDEAIHDNVVQVDISCRLRAPAPVLTR
jgi:hypothetical protein